MERLSRSEAEISSFDRIRRVVDIIRERKGKPVSIEVDGIELLFRGPTIEYLNENIRNFIEPDLSIIDESFTTVFTLREDLVEKKLLCMDSRHIPSQIDYLIIRKENSESLDALAKIMEQPHLITPRDILHAL